MASAVEKDEQEGIRLLLKKINEAWVKAERHVCGATGISPVMPLFMN